MSKNQTKKHTFSLQLAHQKIKSGWVTLWMFFSEDGNGKRIKKVGRMGWNGGVKYKSRRNWVLSRGTSFYLSSHFNPIMITMMMIMKLFYPYNFSCCFLLFVFSFLYRNINVLMRMCMCVYVLMTNLIRHEKRSESVECSYVIRRKEKKKERKF